MRKQITEQAFCLEGEDAAGAECVTIRKSAGDDDEAGPLDLRAACRQVEEIDANRCGAGLLQSEGGIAMAVGAGGGEDNGGRFHRAVPLQACSRSLPDQVFAPCGVVMRSS